jgi:hypothetical protein
MNPRSILILLCAVGSFALAPNSWAQQSTISPIYPHVKDFSKDVLDDVQTTRELADSYVSHKEFLRAAQEYESLLKRREDTPAVLTTYPVSMALAGAHFEAAFYRVMNAKSPDLKNNPALYEDNKRIINAHITQVYAHVIGAVRQAEESGISSADVSEFKCDARAKSTAAVSLEGIVNLSPGRLDEAIKGYKQLEACTPDTKSAIQYLTGVRRNMTGSIMGSDSIVSIASSFVETVVPRGNIINFFIKVGYGLYERHQPPVRDLPHGR